MKKCIVQKLEGVLNVAEPEKVDYLNGVVIKFNKDWADGAVAISPYKNISFTEDNIITINCTYIPYDGYGYLIYPRTDKTTESYFIIKDINKEAIKIYLPSAGADIINRRCHIPSRVFFLASVENAKSVTSSNRFNTEAFYGTILDLTKYVSIENFDLSKAVNLNGSLDDFAKGLIYFGKNNSEITVTCNGAFIYLNNSEEVKPKQGDVVKIIFDEVGGYTIFPPK